jgi:hypothetical protein
MSKEESQLTSATVLMAKPFDGGLTFMLELEDGTAASVRLYTKKYDETAKSYVDDEETYAEAEKILAQFGLTPTQEPLTMIASSLQVYHVGGDDDRTSFHPIKVFERFDRIDPKAAKIIKKLKEPITITPITEHSGLRFNIGVDIPIDNETKHFRISQLVIESDDEDEADKVVSIKYTNKEIDGYREDLKSGAIPENMTKSVEKAIEQLVKKERAKKVEELSNIFGQDFEQMIANEETFDVELTVQSIAGDSPVYYLQGTIVR